MVGADERTKRGRGAEAEGWGRGKGVVIHERFSYPFLSQPLPFPIIIALYASRLLAFLASLHGGGAEPKTQPHDLLTGDFFIGSISPFAFTGGGEEP